MPTTGAVRELVALIDLQPEPQLLLDSEARIIHANKAASRLFGVPASQLRLSLLQPRLATSSPSAQLIVRQGTRSTQPTPVRVMLPPLPGTESPRRMEGRVAALTAGALDQRYVWLRLTHHTEAVHRFLTLNNQLADSAREISRRQHLEDELRAQRGWLEVVLRSIGDAVVACDLQGHIVFLNPVAERLAGWASKDAMGRPAPASAFGLLAPTRAWPCATTVLAWTRRRRRKLLTRFSPPSRRAKVQA